jgi:hypothetical protein
MMPLIGSLLVMAAMLPKVKPLRLNLRAGVPSWKLKLPLVFAGRRCWGCSEFRGVIRSTGLRFILLNCGYPQANSTSAVTPFFGVADAKRNCRVGFKCASRLGKINDLVFRTGNIGVVIFTGHLLGLNGD